MQGPLLAPQAPTQSALVAARVAVVVLATPLLLAQVAMVALLVAAGAVEVRPSMVPPQGLAAKALAVKSGSLSSRTDNSWPQ
jgi:hypothetical protein